MAPASRAAGGRRSTPALSQERIVAAAMQLLDEHGLDGLSLRKVATRLGAGVNSLYWYVDSKDDLLMLLADEVLAQLQLPTPTGDWQADCAVAMTELRALLLQHPHAVGLVITRPPSGPAARRSSEWVLQVLHDAGFRGLGLVHVQSTLLTYTFGKVTQEVAWRQRLQAVRDASGETDPPAATTPAATDVAAVLGDYEDRIDPEAFPRSSEMIGLLLHADRDAEFHAGLQAILTGFAAEL